MIMTHAPFLRLPVLLLLGFFLSGCATPHNRKDPLEPFNRAMFGFNEAVDDAILKPVAKGYKAVTPEPIEMMIGNFFSNIDDIVVMINDLLQLKLIEALSDGGRVLINSTIGLFGVVDVASPIGLEKRNEDFGQTLGRYGIANGPYLVLPFLGSSSLRDTAGLVVDRNVTDPLYRINHIRTRNQALALKFTDARARLLDAEKTLEDAALDKYEFMRDAYLQRRRNLVYDGDPPRRKDDDEDLDESKIQDSPSSVAAILSAAEQQPAEPAKTTVSERAPTKPVESAEQLVVTPDQTNDPSGIVTPAMMPALAKAAETTPAQKQVRIWLPVSNAY